MSYIIHIDCVAVSITLTYDHISGHVAFCVLMSLSLQIVGVFHYKIYFLYILEESRNVFWIVPMKTKLLHILCTGISIFQSILESCSIVSNEKIYFFKENHRGPVFIQVTSTLLYWLSIIQGLMDKCHWLLWIFYFNSDSRYYIHIYIIS